jgi:metal-dependent amidase/aminoacylase/carboxypeptidase family protein
MSLRADAAVIQHELAALRRELHQIPEIGLYLPQTQHRVLAAIDALPLEFAASTVREVFGEERFAELPNPMTGSEDFSRVLDRVPGAYAFLGACRTDDPASAPANHSPRAAFDDSVLADGAALLAELALRRPREVGPDRPGRQRRPENSEAGSPTTA